MNKPPQKLGLRSPGMCHANTSRTSLRTGRPGSGQAWDDVSPCRHRTGNYVDRQKCRSRRSRGVPVHRLRPAVQDHSLNLPGSGPSGALPASAAARGDLSLESKEARVPSKLRRHRRPPPLRPRRIGARIGGRGEHTAENVRCRGSFLDQGEPHTLDERGGPHRHSHGLGFHPLHRLRSIHHCFSAA